MGTPAEGQRIARRPSCTTRCGMRWHVCRSVCAALLLFCFVCWQDCYLGWDGALLVIFSRVVLL